MLFHTSAALRFHSLGSQKRVRPTLPPRRFIPLDTRLPNVCSPSLPPAHSIACPLCMFASYCPHTPGILVHCAFASPSRNRLHVPPPRPAPPPMARQYTAFPLTIVPAAIAACPPSLSKPHSGCPQTPRVSTSFWCRRCGAATAAISHTSHVGPHRARGRRCDIARGQHWRCACI
jgi:hypothetical protein